MDPNSNLLEQRQIAKAIQADPDAHSYGAVRLAELVEALDEWISMGGFIPAQWKGTNPITLQCNMREGCKNPVTHIGEQGWIYCKTCAVNRRGAERCRPLRVREIEKLLAGQTTSWKGTK